MRIIEKMSEMIEDEIDGMKCYAKTALEMRDEYPEIAEHMYKRSLEEKAHADGLHKDVVKIIESYRAEKGDPPADMMAVYNYLHKQHIDAYSKAVSYQNQYKDS
jgi:bacterioferritin (cytochrome b1)